MAALLLARLALLSITLVSLAGGAALADPLPDGWVQALQGVTPDPAPEKLTNNRHYFTSNEHQHWLWREQLTDSGGVFVGLATDQNYLMAGWAKPELLVLVDFDQLVVDLHAAYGVAFRNADDPAAFLALWRPSGVEPMKALLATDFPAEADRKRAWKAYRRARSGVEKRLDWTLRAAREAGVSTFLDDGKQYTTVATLWREGRVVAIRGDLNSSGMLRDLGKALTGLGQSIRTLYLSNAEQYFSYKPAFRKNMLALPFDDRSLVLRTTHIGKLRYVYVTQSGPNFHAWMAHSRISHVYGMYPPKKSREGKRLFAIDRLPRQRAQKQGFGK